MASISNRIILLVISLILASYVLWAGVELGAWWTVLESKHSLHQREQMLRFFVWEFCVVVGVLGSIIFVHLLTKIVKHERCDEVGTTVEAGAGLICFWFLFGVASDGNRLSLLDPSGFLFVIGMTPIVFITKDLLVDMFSPVEESREKEVKRH